jgi:hypothetical protein
VSPVLLQPEASKKAMRVGRCFMKFLQSWVACLVHPSTSPSGPSPRQTELGSLG